MSHSTSAWGAVSLEILPLTCRQRYSQKLVYSNSVLATLNARQSIRGLGEDSDELSFSLQSISKRQRTNNSTVLILITTIYIL
jgi:hypothetical protein